MDSGPAQKIVLGVASESLGWVSDSRKKRRLIDMLEETATSYERVEFDIGSEHCAATAYNVLCKGDDPNTTVSRKTEGGVAREH